MGSFDHAIERLGIILPAMPKPVASYVPFVRTGNLVFVSGQLPSKEGKVQFLGAVPTAVSVEAGVAAAKLCAINALAVLREACAGDLDRVVRIVRIGVFVQSADGFDAQAKVANGASDLLVAIFGDAQAKVANGASDLLVAIFGDAGKHARAAVGTNALPLNAAVEVELMAEVR